MQMALRQMEIDSGVREIRVPQQHLDRAQVRAGFEQVRVPAPVVLPRSRL